jgi:hypothetical protein
MSVSTFDATHDAVAIARSLGRGDRDGAWSVFGPKTSEERVALVVCLGVFLAHAVGDDEQAWLDLIEIASRMPR